MFWILLNQQGWVVCESCCDLRWRSHACGVITIHLRAFVMIGHGAYSDRASGSS